MRLVPAILCGGAGSRLWPVSRELHPKPFIRLADGQSLLQKAFLRAASLPGVDEVLTVTNRELYFKTRDEYREVEKAVATPYILEPFGRGTAAVGSVGDGSTVRDGGPRNEAVGGSANGSSAVMAASAWVRVHEPPCVYCASARS